MRLICFTVFLTAAVLLMVCPGMGQFAVNVLVDSQDASPGDGVCADAGGNCSLRAAVMEANATAGPNDVFLPAGDYLNSPLTGLFRAVRWYHALNLDFIEVRKNSSSSLLLKSQSIGHIRAGVGMDYRVCLHCVATFYTNR